MSLVDVDKIQYTCYAGYRIYSALASSTHNGPHSIL